MTGWEQCATNKWVAMENTVMGEVETAFYEIKGRNLDGEPCDASISGFFDGPMPVVGDVLEIVCTEREVGFVRAKLRVKRLVSPHGLVTAFSE